MSSIPDIIQPVPRVCVIPGLGIIHINPPAKALQNPIATPSGTCSSFLFFSIFTLEFFGTNEEKSKDELLSALLSFKIIDSYKSSKNSLSI